MEVVRGATPKDKLEEFDTNIKRAKEMMNSWEETYTMFQERLQLFTTTQLIDVIRVKNVNEIGVLYDYNLTFESDGKEWEIEVEAIELNQKIYLMKFK